MREGMVDFSLASNVWNVWNVMECLECIVQSFCSNRMESNHTFEGYNQTNTQREIDHYYCCHVYEYLESQYREVSVYHLTLFTSIGSLVYGYYHSLSYNRLPNANPETRN